MKKHGIGLKIFLVLMLIVNPLAAFTYFTNPGSVSAYYPNATVPLIYLLGIFCIINIILCIAVWKWKRIGIYGFYAVCVLSVGVNSYIGIPLVTSLIGTLGGFIMYFLTRKKWKSFT